MEINEAITTFSQSEKIKAGLIWASQAVELYNALPETDRAGAAKIISAMVDMIGSEIHICRKTAPNELWTEVEKNIDTAMVMINSNIVHEASYHLTQALTKTTTIGQRSMSILTNKKLL